MSRLLFLTESFHPVLGGGERHIRLLSKALAAEGLPSTVLTRRTSVDFPEEEWLDGVRILRVSPTGPGRRGKYVMVPHVLRTLVRERETFDILVVRGTRVLGLPGLLAGRALRKKVVLQPELNGEFSGEVYTFGTPLDGGLGEWVIRLGNSLRKGFLADADAVVAMSSAIRSECVSAGVEPERISLIPHGVATDEFSPLGTEDRADLRRKLGLPDPALIIVYSGRLLRGKGLEGLVEAFSEIALPQAHLLLLGSGEGQTISVEADLKESVAKRNLGSRVTFAGRRDNVATYLRASDLFVFPSLYEALGIALIEAQASGLPAVASRTGGIVDVIEDGETGLLVRPGDVAGLRSAIGALLSDPKRRAAMGRAARARAEKLFGEKGSFLRYRTLFQELGPNAAAGRVTR